MAVAVAPAVVYVAGRIVQLVLSGDPVRTADTPTYRPLASGWLSFDKVSVVGHAMRPWTITAPYAFMPNDRWRVLLQFSVGTVAWAVLLGAVACLPISAWRRGALGLAIATIGLSVGVAVWDWNLLSESILMSATVVFVAAALWVLAAPSSPLGPAVMVLASLYCVVTRVTFAPLALGALVCCAVVARTMPRRQRHRFIAAASLVVVVGLAYAGWYSDQIDRWWGREASRAVAASGAVPAITTFRGRTVQQFGVLAWSPAGDDLVPRLAGAGALVASSRRSLDRATVSCGGTTGSWTARAASGG